MRSVSALLERDPAVARNLSRIFNQEEMVAIADKVRRDQQARRLFRGLSGSEIAMLRVHIESVRRGGQVSNAHGDSLIQMSKLIMVVHESGLETDYNFSGMNPSKACKALNSMLFNKRRYDQKGALLSSEGRFEYEAGKGKEQSTIIFDQDNKLLQMLALDSIKNCFSFRATHRNVAEAYLRGSDFFFVPILKGEEVVARMTVGFGYLDSGANPISDENRFVARFSRVYLKSKKHLHVAYEADKAVQAFAESMTNAGIAVKHLSPEPSSKTKVLIKVQSWRMLFSSSPVYNDATNNPYFEIPEDNSESRTARMLSWPTRFLSTLQTSRSLHPNMFLPDPSKPALLRIVSLPFFRAVFISPEYALKEYFDYVPEKPKLYKISEDPAAMP